MKIWIIGLRAVGYISGTAGALLATRSAPGSMARIWALALLWVMLFAFLGAMILRVTEQWRTAHRAPGGPPHRWIRRPEPPPGASDQPPTPNGESQS